MGFLDINLPDGSILPKVSRHEAVCGGLRPGYKHYSLQNIFNCSYKLATKAFNRPWNASLLVHWRRSHALQAFICA